MKPKHLIFYTGILVLILVLAAFGYQYLSENYHPQYPAQQTVQKRKPAPDFTVYTADGSPVKLSDFQEKSVIINFWATWCGPCKSELPAFEKVYQEFGDQIHILMINLTDGHQETKEGVQTFLEKNGYSFPVYYDTETSAALAYRIRSIPQTVFIDKEGNLIKSHTGAMSEDTLIRYLPGLIKEST